MFLDCAPYHNYKTLKAAKTELAGCRDNYLEAERSLVILGAANVISLADRQQIYEPALEGLRVQLNLLMLQGKDIKVTSPQYTEWKTNYEAACKRIDEMLTIFHSMVGGGQNGNP